jgi:hypothetical protein
MIKKVRIYNDRLWFSGIKSGTAGVHGAALGADEIKTGPAEP